MNRARAFRYSILILALVLFSAFVIAEDLPFSTKYEEDFFDGESIKQTFVELDKITFTYNGDNHTFRLMTANSHKCDIIVDKTGVEIELGQTLSFALAPGSMGDLNVTLKSIGDDAATFRLTLSSKFLEPEDDGSGDDDSSDDSSTNSTDTNSTDANPPANNSPPNSNPSNTNSNANTNSNTNSNTQNTESANTTAPISSSPSPTGGTTVNINFNINFPEGSGVGFLIIVAIVLGGLLVYKKFRYKIEKHQKVYKKSRKKKR